VAARSLEPSIRTRAAAEIKGSRGGPPVPGSELAEADALGLIVLPLPIIWSLLVALAEDGVLDMALALDFALALDMAEDEVLDFMLSSPIILSLPICCAMAAGAKASAASATNMAR